MMISTAPVFGLGLTRAAFSFRYRPLFSAPHLPAIANRGRSYAGGQPHRRRGAGSPAFSGLRASAFGRPLGRNAASAMIAGRMTDRTSDAGRALANHAVSASGASASILAGFGLADISGYLPVVGLPQADDANAVVSRGKDQHVQPTFDQFERLWEFLPS